MTSRRVAWLYLPSIPEFRSLTKTTWRKYQALTRHPLILLFLTPVRASAVRSAAMYDLSATTNVSLTPDNLSPFTQPRKKFPLPTNSFRRMMIDSPFHGCHRQRYRDPRQQSCSCTNDAVSLTTTRTTREHLIGYSGEEPETLRTFFALIGRHRTSLETLRMPGGSSRCHRRTGRCQMKVLFIYLRLMLNVEHQTISRMSMEAFECSKCNQPGSQVSLS